MNIRLIAASELDDLLDLYSHLHEADAPLPARSTVENVWRKIQGGPGYNCFGVFENGRLVSTCILCVLPNLTRSCRSCGVIENVVTHPDFRRRGFGKAVLGYALQHAWSQGCYKVMLLTGRKNEATFRFYESAGFDRDSKQAFLAKPQSTIRDGQ